SSFFGCEFGWGGVGFDRSDADSAGLELRLQRVGVDRVVGHRVDGDIGRERVGPVHGRETDARAHGAVHVCGQHGSAAAGTDLDLVAVAYPEPGGVLGV